MQNWLGSLKLHPCFSTFFALFFFTNLNTRRSRFLADAQANVFSKIGDNAVSDNYDHLTTGCILISPTYGGMARLREPGWSWKYRNGIDPPNMVTNLSNQYTNRAWRSGVNGSVTLGEWTDARKQVGPPYPGGRKLPNGVQRGRPNGRTPQADTYFGNKCKTYILRSKNRKCIHVTLFS